MEIKTGTKIKAKIGGKIETNYELEKFRLNLPDTPALQ